MTSLKQLSQHARLHREARRLCQAGDYASAKAFAEEHNFKLADIPGLTIPVTADFRPLDAREPWPAECIAMIWRYCRNKRLVVIHIDDGREASLWTMGRTYRLGTRLKVKLEEAQGDPYYVAVPGGME